MRALPVVFLVALVALLCAGCGSSSKPLPGWDEVAKSSSAEDGSVERARGTVERPTTFAIRVEGSKGVTAHVTYTLACTGAPPPRKAETKVTTPGIVTLLAPADNPKSCTMVATVKQPVSGNVHLTIYARSNPPRA